MALEITARKKWQLFGLSDIIELCHYKDLLYRLVRRDVNILYRQTVLGFAWAIIKPLVQMILFTLVFGKFVGLDKLVGAGVPYPVFSFAALVPWTYFSTAMSGSSASLIANSQFLTKVYFPRIIIPLTPTISKLVDFSIAFIVLMLLSLYYHLPLNASLIFIPVLVGIMLMLTFGMGLWLSAMSVQYRDVQQLMQFVVQLLMYAAPVIWPMSVLPNIPWLKEIYALYPMVGIIEGFRAALLGTPMPWEYILIGAGSSFIILFTGLIYFRAKEDYFADVV
jgi:lipopolysaccharide transport system permease protein